MSEPTILFKTIITVEVLSDTPYDFRNLVQTVYDITEGDCSGLVTACKSVPIEGAEAIQTECDKHGTDVSFFCDGDEDVYDWWTEDTIGEK